MPRIKTEYWVCCRCNKEFDRMQERCNLFIGKIVITGNVSFDEVFFDITHNRVQEIEHEALCQTCTEELVTAWNDK